jgi:hypothetical protein
VGLLGSGKPNKNNNQQQTGNYSGAQQGQQHGQGGLMGSFGNMASGFMGGGNHGGQVS